jgi:hypothetical protein
MNDAVVRPDLFTIRWTYSRREQFISLVILDEVGNILWQQQNINSKVGQLVSDGARSALSHYRDKGVRINLWLRLIRPNHSTTQVRFTMISSENERNLLGELAKWDQEESPIMRRGMMTETVEEYETALNEMPESRDLLLVTIRANRKIGNMPRVAELTKRLK